MRVINLLGGPGTGKSTTASGLFYKMKIKGHNVELVTEYAKDMTWENRHNILQDQLYILAKQNRRLERLRGKVDFAITDSPIILGLNYMPDGYPETFESFVMDMWKSYDNQNFYLYNSGDLTYQETGRNQDIKEAKQMDNKIHKFVTSRNIIHTPIKIIANDENTSTNHVNDIYNEILKNMGE